MPTKMLFPTGRLLSTPGALDALADVAPWGTTKPTGILFRHFTGDWGELDDEDKAANDKALVNGERLLSAYTTPKGVKLWVITEADRSATTILLPEEY